MALTKQQIQEEFNNRPKNWHNIYQWTKCTTFSYTEKISELLLKEFDQIKWCEKGLRKDKFKQVSHIGHCKPNKDITQFREKIFCRALFNAGSIDLLGKIIDYEIPLTEPKQGKGKQSHGDIDLLSQKDNILFFIEAKKYKSTESLLKAILEIFVYTYRLHTFKIIDSFKQDYECAENMIIVPAVLTFSDSTSGKQIKEIHNYPNLKRLLKRINEELNKFDIKNIEFYVVDNFIIENALIATPPYNKDNINKNYKIELKEPISIVKISNMNSL